MDKAMMNHTDGLVELTVQELAAVAGGIGEQPPRPKLTLETNLVTIGADPPPPTK